MSPLTIRGDLEFMNYGNYQLLKSPSSSCFYSSLLSSPWILNDIFKWKISALILKVRLFIAWCSDTGFICPHRYGVSYIYIWPYLIVSLSINWEDFSKAHLNKSSFSGAGPHGCDEFNQDNFIAGLTTHFNHWKILSVHVSHFISCKILPIS